MNEDTANLLQKAKIDILSNRTAAIVNVTYDKALKEAKKNLKRFTA